MALQLHRTRDPRLHRLRNPPAWYQHQTTLFWTEMAAARMEKLCAETQRHQWEATQPPNRLCDASIAESLVCPCIVYGRTSNRLRAALGGRDPSEVDTHGCCVADCAQITFCFPFYGCFLAKLQTTVRSFYGVDGSDYSDWCEGCFCPCVALVRNEKEIMLREGQQHRRRKNVTDRDSSFAEQYQPPDPMQLPAEQSRAPNLREHIPQLPPIPSSIDVTHGPDVSQVAKQKLPSIAEVSREDSTASAVHTPVHDLSQDTAVVPVHGKSKVHRLGDEEDVATLTNPPEAGTSGEAKHDATAAEEGVQTVDEVARAAKKAAPGDRLAKLGSLISGQIKHVKLSSRESSEHAVDQDQSTAKSTDKSADKSIDKSTDKSRQPVKTHDLLDDAVNPPSSRGPAVPHTLDEDEATSNPSRIPQSHKLQDDK